INEDQLKQTEIHQNEEIQKNNDESTASSSSTVPKHTTHHDQQDPRKLLAAEINERDIQAAAASALSAASVKAKVCLFEIKTKKQKILSINEFSSITENCFLLIHVFIIESSILNSTVIIR
ncbi:unnamed protein product, partial [Rotaria sordida]